MGKKKTGKTLTRKTLTWKTLTLMVSIRKVLVLVKDSRVKLVKKAKMVKDSKVMMKTLPRTLMKIGKKKTGKALMVTKILTGKTLTKNLMVKRTKVLVKAQKVKVKVKAQKV